MRSRRFPKGKYLRQLVVIEEDLYEWRLAYMERAVREPSPRLRALLEDRVAVLDDAAYRVRKAHEMIDGVPRLS